MQTQAPVPMAFSNSWTYFTNVAFQVIFKGFNASRREHVEKFREITGGEEGKEMEVCLQ